MKRFFLWFIIVAVILIAGWYFLLKPSGLISEPVDAIPSNAFIIFESENISAFEAQYFQSQQWDDLRKISVLNTLEKSVAQLQSFISSDAKLAEALSNEKIMAAAISVGSGNVEYVFIAKTPGYRLKAIEWKSDDQLAIVKSYRSNKETIYTYANTGADFACAKANGMLIFSSSKVLVESAILQLKESSGASADPSFMQVFALSSKNNVSDVFLNMEQLALYTGKLVNSEYYKTLQQLGKFTSWFALELHFEENKISLHGYASSKEESQTILSKYLDTEFNFDEVDNFLLRNTAYILQGNITGGLFSNASNELLTEWAPWLGSHYTYAVSQTYDAAVENKSYIILEVTDEDLALRNLSLLSENTFNNYRDYTMYSIPSSDIMSGVSGFGKSEIAVYAVVIQGYLIVSPSANQLMSVVDAYMNQQTLKQDQEYLMLKSNAASTCNFGIYLNPALCGEILKSISASDSITMPALEKFNGLMMRFSSTKNAHIISGAMLYSAEAKASSGFAWKTRLEHDIMHGPYTIKNHISGKENIFLQDTSNQVYLISQDGNIEWKRKLNFPITDNVVTVDFYNNGKKQILFAATDGIYMLDMLGRDVEGFPISVTTEVTSPISVIDYDGKGDYRMFIGCGNGNVYGYYKDGKPLPGWSPLKNAGTIQFPFTYIQSNQKDYIAFSNASGAISLKNRKGENRAKNIKAQNSLISSIIPDNQKSTNQFLAIDSRYNVMLISPEGKIESEIISQDIQDALLVDINNDGNTDIVYLTSTAVIAQSLDKKEIWNYSFGNTTGFELYSYRKGNSVYIGLVNRLIQKFFLLNNSGALINGFPVEAAYQFILIESGSLVVSAMQNFVVAYNIK